jgi:hypothetical protein
MITSPRTKSESVREKGQAQSPERSGEALAKDGGIFSANFEMPRESVLSAPAVIAHCGIRHRAACRSGERFARTSLGLQLPPLAHYGSTITARRLWRGLTRRRRLFRCSPFRRRRGNQFFETRIIPKRIEHRIELEQRWSERHAKPESA